MYLTIIFLLSGFNGPTSNYDTLIPNIEENYIYLLNYRPEIIIWEDLVFIASSQYRSFRAFDNYQATEKINPAYCRKFYKDRYAYDIIAELKQSLSKDKDEWGPFFLNLNTDLSGRYYLIRNQFFISSRARSKMKLNRLYTYVRPDNDISSEIQVGAGIGQIKPIFAIDKSIKIQKELLDMGIIKEKFTYTKLKEIADHIGNRGQYGNPKDFWRELEEIITDSGVIEGEKLGAAATIVLSKLIEINPNWRWTYDARQSPHSINYSEYHNAWKRHYDWDFSGKKRGFEVIGYIGHNYYNHFSDSRRNRIFLGGIFNLEYPLSYKLQFSVNSAAEFFLEDTLLWREAYIQTKLRYENFRDLYSKFTIRYNGLNGRKLWETQLGLDYLMEYKFILTGSYILRYSPEQNDFYSDLCFGIKYLLF